MRVARRTLGVLAFCLVFAGGYALAGTANVTLTPNGPQPATVTVDWGDTVIFTNGDTVARGITSQRAAIESPMLPPGGTFEHRYDGRSGRYSYFQTGTRPLTAGVVVVDADGKVTLKTSKRVALYKTAVTLSGTSTYAGTPVVVQLRKSGSTGEWITLLNRTAAADGSYSGKVRLVAGGRLRALVAGGEVSSDFADVGVKPRLVASAKPRRAKEGARVVVSARVIPGAAAGSADLERYRADRKSWVREASKNVAKSGKVAFAVKAAKGRTLYRISLRRGSLQPGFEQTVSKTVRVQGT